MRRAYPGIGQKARWCGVTSIGRKETEGLSVGDGFERERERERDSERESHTTKDMDRKNEARKVKRRNAHGRKPEEG